MYMRFKKRRGRPRSARLGKRRRKVLIARSIILGVSVVVLVYLLAWVFRLEQINIDEIRISGNSIVKNEEIMKVANRDLDKTYFLLSPKTNILFYPKQKIIRDLQTKFTLIETVDIKFRNFHTIEIKVVERKPFALWCGKEIVSNSGCYFLDKNGFIFSKAPDFTGSVFFKFYGKNFSQGQSLGDTVLGSEYMEVEEFNGFQLFNKSLNNIGLKPVLLLKVDSRDYNMWLESGTKIQFSKEQSLTTLLDNLESILNSESLTNESIKNIEYIDLRFGNKVYYKFIGE